ncbi:MAG: elongation factor P [Chloroflexota bacterium]
MISSGELRKCITIELDGQLYSVLDYQHIKMGRGSAQVRLRLRDVRAGHNIERTFQAGDRWARARLDRHTVQFLYEDSGLYYFMDTETFEQTTLNTDQLGDNLKYLKENITLDLLNYNKESIGVELPNSIDLQVVDTGPSFKGDTAQGGTKPAELETGITVQVPLFINNGDVVRIDTRTGNYIERAS